MDPKPSNLYFHTKGQRETLKKVIVAELKHQLEGHNIPSVGKIDSVISMWSRHKLLVEELCYNCNTKLIDRDFKKYCTGCDAVRTWELKDQEAWNKAFEKQDQVIKDFWKDKQEKFNEIHKHLTTEQNHLRIWYRTLYEACPTCGKIPISVVKIFKQTCKCGTKEVTANEAKFKIEESHICPICYTPNKYVPFKTEKLKTCCCRMKQKDVEFEALKRLNSAILGKARDQKIEIGDDESILYREIGKEIFHQQLKIFKEENDTFKVMYERESKLKPIDDDDP
jgi:hypothetical protein